MKKILAVNIDPIALNIISNFLMEQTTEFEILTADKIGELHEIAEKLKIDVALIDLVKPTIADAEILKFVGTSHPRLPMIVMSEFNTAEIESIIKSIATVRYFEKPVEYEQIAGKIFEEIKTGVGGAIQGISLASFLQMSEMERTSCTLTVKAGEKGEKTGQLFLIKGALVAAETGELKGDEAVYEILSWDSPIIEIEHARPDRTKEITTPLMNLLMEGVRRKDEKAGKKRGKKKVAIKDAKKAALDKEGAEEADIEKLELEKGPAPEVPEEKKKRKKKKKAEKAPPESPEYKEAIEKIEQLKSAGKISDASKILKRKKQVTRSVAILIAILFAVSMVYAWVYGLRPWFEKIKYEKLIANIDATQNAREKIALLDEYIKARPHGHYTKQARDKRGELAKQLALEDFDQTIRKVSDLPIDDKFAEKARQLYEKYLKQYPESPYRSEIKKRIAGIPDILNDAEYRKLREIPKNDYSARIAAYNKYIKKYPDGKNTKNVREMLANLGEDLYWHIAKKKRECDRQKDWSGCITLCKYFEKYFSGHKRAGEVKKLEAVMEDQEAFKALSEEIKEKGEYSLEAKNLYLEFLKKHPSTSLRKTIEKNISTIERIEREKKEWDDTVAYIQNTKISIFDRANRMRSYVAKNPPKTYRKEAQQILAWLEKQEQKARQDIEQKKRIEEQKRKKQAELARLRMEIVKKLAATSGRYVEKKPYTITDTKTGLTWVMLDSQTMTGNCMDYKSAKEYVKNLKTGGYDDWRLPLPSELLVIYNDRPSFPAKGRTWYWTSEVFAAAWEKRVNAVKQTGAGIWKKWETGLNSCGAVRAVRP